MKPRFAVADALTALRLPLAVLFPLVRAPVWQDYAPAALSFAHAPEAPFPTYWVRSQGGSHQLTAWAGGPHARAFVAMGMYLNIARALDLPKEYAGEE